MFPDSFPVTLLLLCLPVNCAEKISYLPSSWKNSFLSLLQSVLFLLLLLFRFFAVFRIISRSSFSFPTSQAAPSAEPFSIFLPLNALLLRHPPLKYPPIRIYRLKVSEIYFQNVFRVVLWSEASSRFFLCLFK